MKLTYKIWMTTLIVVFGLLLVACDSPNTLLDTMNTVETNLPIALNDGDVFTITNPNPDLVTITWVSSNKDLLDSEGNVYAKTSDQTVTITIIFEFGDSTESIDYDIIINKKDILDDTTLNDVKDALSIEGETTVDLELPTMVGDVSITWSSDKEAISNTGVVTRDTVDIEVSLTATLTYYDETDTKVFTVVVKFQVVGDQELASDSEFSIHTFEVTILPPALSEIVLTITETELTWTVVDHATTYEVYVNDILQTEGILELTFIIPTEVGSHSIKVVTLAEGYILSDATVEYIVAS